MSQRPIYTIVKTIGKKVSILTIKKLEDGSAWGYCSPCQAIVTPAVHGDYSKEAFSEWFDRHIQLFPRPHGANEDYKLF